MRIALASTLAVLFLAWFTVGCEPAGEDVYTRLIKQEQLTRHCEQENAVLQQDLARQQQQIETLQALGDKRLQQLYFVESIQLGRHTGGWDLDDKPGQDGIKVFLVPHDQYGSAIKAAGAATVQLYDLAAEPDKTLIAEFDWPVDELPDSWASGFMSYHYTLDCLWGDNPPANDIITVRVVFVDYLTGNTFQAQKVCKIDLTVPPDKPDAPDVPDAPDESTAAQ